MRQGKDAEFIDGVHSSGDGMKQPGEVVPINALRKERDNSKKFSGIIAELLNRWGGQR